MRIIDGVCFYYFLKIILEGLRRAFKAKFENYYLGLLQGMVLQDVRRGFILYNIGYGTVFTTSQNIRIFHEPHAPAILSCRRHPWWRYSWRRLARWGGTRTSQAAFSRACQSPLPAGWLCAPVPYGGMSACQDLAAGVRMRCSGRQPH